MNALSIVKLLASAYALAAFSPLHALNNGTTAKSVAVAQAAGQTAMTAVTQYVDVAGNKIAYRDIGSGEPMILLNRMRGTLDTWDPLLIDGLAATHRVILVDYPGVGYSSGVLPENMGAAAAFVDAFASAMRLQRYILAGWSWGGAVTQAASLEFPERVSHAVVIGANPPGPVARPIQAAFLERAFKPVNDLADEEVLFFEPASEVSREAAAASRQRIYARPGVDENIPSSPEQIQAYITVAQGFTADAEGRRAKLTSSRVPMLVIAGDNDISTAGQNWFPLIGEMPNAHFVVFPEAGHGPQHQYPELTVSHINAFLEYAVD